MDQYTNTSTSPRTDPLADYHSVEVAMEKMRLSYQFKIWHTDHNSIFLLVKENSKILSQLKVGNILPLKYYASNAMAHCEVKDTQIENIVNEKQGKFKGHHRVELIILSN